MASTRLPRKPLADIAGIPMIVRVATQVSQAAVDTVVVAVDDQQVFEVVEKAGYRVLMTKTDHASGSDRVMEVANQCNWSDSDIVINVQGDEPLMPPEIVNSLATLMRENDNIEMATLSEPIDNFADFMNPNIVKVVVDDKNDALYFSRSPIPYPRDEMSDDGMDEQQMGALGARRHVGVYAFRVSALRRFVTLQDSRFERIERLEQLRWLEAGYDIRVLQSPIAIPGGIDTPQDLARVVDILDSRPHSSS